MATKRPSLHRAPVKDRAPSSLHRADYQVFLDVLRDMRVQAGLTQEAMAQAIQRNQTFVSAIERGEWRADLLQVKDMCDVCGVSLPEFAKRLDKALKQAGY